MDKEKQFWDDAWMKGVIKEDLNDDLSPEEYYRRKLESAKIKSKDLPDIEAEAPV